MITMSECAFPDCGCVGQCRNPLTMTPKPPRARPDHAFRAVADAAAQVLKLIDTMEGARCPEAEIDTTRTAHRLLLQARDLLRRM